MNLLFSKNKPDKAPLPPPKKIPDRSLQMAPPSSKVVSNVTSRKEIETKSIRKDIEQYFMACLNKLNPVRIDVLNELAACNDIRIDWKLMKAHLNRSLFKEAATLILESMQVHSVHKAVHLSKMMEYGKVIDPKAALTQQATSAPVRNMAQVLGLKDLNNSFSSKTSVETAASMSNSRLLETKQGKRNKHPRGEPKQIIKEAQGIVVRGLKKNRTLAGVDMAFDLTNLCFDGFHKGKRHIRMSHGVWAGEGDFNFLDMIVPLKLMFDPKIRCGSLSVSLDPLVDTDPDGPTYKKVFYPQELRNTHFGEVMIEADYLMKQLSLGVDDHNRPFPYPKELVDLGFPAQIRNQLDPSKLTHEVRQRLWIVINDCDIQKRNNAYIVRNVKMGAMVKRMVISNEGTLEDSQADNLPSKVKFCELFSKHYDLLEKHYPVYKQLKVMAKATLVAQLMRRADVSIDLDLISRLYDGQKLKVNQTVNRLSNRIQDKKKGIISHLSGGCSFFDKSTNQKIQAILSRSEQKNKIQNLVIHKTDNPEIEATVPLTLWKKNRIEDDIETDYSDSEEQQVLMAKQWVVCPFEASIPCRIEGCKETVNHDYYSVKNKECRKHTTMRCGCCKKLVQRGESYIHLEQKTLCFHKKCFDCSECSLAIDEKFRKIKGKFYHPLCAPKQQCGWCSLCSKSVFKGQTYLKGPKDEKYHPACHQEMEKRNAIYCTSCKKQIKGPYLVYSDGRKIHKQCDNPN